MMHTSRSITTTMANKTLVFVIIAHIREIINNIGVNYFSNIIIFQNFYDEINNINNLTINHYVKTSLACLILADLPCPFCGHIQRNKMSSHRCFIYSLLSCFLFIIFVQSYQRCCASFYNR